MSAVQCVKCDQIFSAKDDPDCYVEKSPYINQAQPVAPKAKEPIEYEVICDSCREEEEMSYE